MNPHDRKPELIPLIAALALGLGVVACQDRAPEKMSGAPDSERIIRQPTGTPGVAAGTAEGKMMQGGDSANSPAMADAALAARVKAALSAEPELKALAVDVAASGNAVTLNGTADNTSNRDKASLVALGVQGVNSVENRLVVARGS